MRTISLLLGACVLWASAALATGLPALRGTGDLGIIIERANGSVQVIETTGRTSLGRIEGLARWWPEQD